MCHSPVTRAAESSHSSNVTTSNPLDLPYLPFLSFESELDWVGAQAKDSWNWSRLNSVVARRRLREGHERQPLLHAHGRPDGAVFGEQQQAHGRLLRREHAEAERRSHGRCRRWTDRSHYDRDGRHAPQDQLHAVREHVHRLQSQLRNQARAASRACARTSLSDVHSFRPRRRC